jgi:hypothetical protein
MRYIECVINGLINVIDFTLGDGRGGESIYGHKFNE